MDPYFIACDTLQDKIVTLKRLVLQKSDVFFVYFDSVRVFSLAFLASGIVPGV